MDGNHVCAQTGGVCQFLVADLALRVDGWALEATQDDVMRLLHVFGEEAARSELPGTVFAQELAVVLRPARQGRVVNGVVQLQFSPRIVWDATDLTDVVALKIQQRLQN